MSDHKCSDQGGFSCDYLLDSSEDAQLIHIIETAISSYADVIDNKLNVKAVVGYFSAKYGES